MNKALNNKKVIIGLLKRLKNYKLSIFVSILFSIITVIFSLYIPLLIGNTIDLIVAQNTVNFDLMFDLFVKISMLTGIIVVFQWIMNVLNNKITYHVIEDIRIEAICKLQKVPLSYIDKHSTGDIVSRVIADVDQLAEGLLLGFTQLFSGIVTIITTLVFMLTRHIGITIIVVILTPLSILMARFIAKHIHSMFIKQAETKGEQTAFIDEMISNQKIIKAFNREDESIEKFININNKLQKTSLKAMFFSSLTNPCTRFINAVIYAIVAFVGALVVISGGTLTVGGLASFLSYANQYTKPFNEISSVITELQNAFACASRIFELIDEAPVIEECTTPLELSNTKDNIIFSNVSFSYRPEQKLISNFSLNVQQGQTIAIVGPTGCGKTTLINLLMRFYDVTKGEICIDGHNIKEYSRSSLRNNIGMVLQDTWIKHGTVAENIAIGKPNATMDEIVEAAKLSHAHNFIKKLPQGYDTIISEEDNGFSVGQKQLLCIARVMLRKPPILILDEATSSIDTRTEIKIQDAFATLMKDCTTFIVAHRLSTIREADTILVMKDGNVIEKGTHDNLLKKKGFYYNLYNSQFENQEIS